MITYKYIVLEKDFCEKFNAYGDGLNRFCYGVTLDGRYVAAIERWDEFPDLFIGIDPLVVELSAEDFFK